MELATEIRLLGDLKQLADSRQCFVAETTASNAVWKYTSQSRLDAELEEVLRPLPQIAAHSSELPCANAFLRRDVLGMPVLMTRDEQGVVHAFLNVCRHRGTRLVDADSGCQARLTCPYHAWSWNTRGELLKIPFGEEGFPDADPTQLGLKSLPCEERHGWIFVCAQDAEMDLDAYLGDLTMDLEWLAAQDLEVKGAHTVDRAANWKLLVEGGLEAYHFRVVHRKTIGPHFPNNLSSYESFGDHLRSILPRATINNLDIERVDRSVIREQANVLYTF
ncbi:MAG: aromatic ring-hydroxylating oxygenase subunit alpha, partial [Granulosicoccaceae bacterium]